MRCRRRLNGRRPLPAVSNRGGDGFRHAGLVHEVGEQLVASRRQVRQALLEDAGPRSASGGDATVDRAPARRRTGASGGRDRARSRRARRLRIQPGSRSVSVETAVGHAPAPLRAACRHSARSSPPRRSTTSCRDSTATATTAAAIAPAMRPRRRAARSGRLARAAALPPARSSRRCRRSRRRGGTIRQASSTPSARLIAQRRLAAAWAPARPACPDPRSPRRRRAPARRPAVIIQRWPVNSRASSGDRDATSGTGANCAPGPVSGSGTMRTSRTSSLVVRTSTSATPGIACGGLMVTKTLVRPGLAVEKHVGAADVRGRRATARRGDERASRDRAAAIAEPQTAGHRLTASRHPLHGAAERAVPSVGHHAGR